MVAAGDDCVDGRVCVHDGACGDGIHETLKLTEIVFCAQHCYSVVHIIPLPRLYSFSLHIIVNILNIPFCL